MSVLSDPEDYIEQLNVTSLTINEEITNAMQLLTNEQSQKHDVIGEAAMVTEITRVTKLIEAIEHH
jgi:hypothetical protein